MIVADEDPILSDNRTLKNYIEQTIQSLKVENSCPPLIISEVAHTVADYCVNQFDRNAFPSDYLWLQIARTLSGVGESAFAQELIKLQCSDKTIKNEIVFLLAKKTVPLKLYYAWQNRVVHPLHSNLLAHQEAWVLDFNVIETMSTALIEITFLRYIKELLHSISMLWDEVDGEGTLGLKNLNRFLLSTFMRNSSNREIRRMRKELLRYVGDVLTQVSISKGWEHTPMIIQL